ncbi:hypothetical protein P4B35_01040 [Pontiellaceae bacterium B12227]|nr:hypothetical protein [Pontiellaceae bacterium B12227]
MRNKMAWITLAVSTALSCAMAESEWEYLDNGVVRIGVDKARGSGIGYFGESKTGRNLLNHFDEGRFIQQSYYGAPDGSFWNKKPWTYNPVQGGSWDGKKAATLAFRKTEQSLYAKIEPRNWSGGQRCPEAIMEQTLMLTGAVAKVTFKMSFTGKDQGKPRHQEMPAVFVDAALSNLVYYTDGKLIRRIPGWPNESGRTSEHWTAWLNQDDWGIGIYTPGTDGFTCYRFGTGATGSEASACSYIAPVRTFALKGGLVVEYDVFLTIGTLEEIERRFAEIKHDNG